VLSPWAEQRSVCEPFTGVMAPVPRPGPLSPSSRGKTNAAGEECSLSGSCGPEACTRRRDDRVAKPGLSVSCRWSVSTSPGSASKVIEVVGDRAQATVLTKESRSVLGGSPSSGRLLPCLGSGNGVPGQSTALPKGAPARGAGREHLEQSFLDFGQRNGAGPVTCPECGCTYVVGVAADERAHTSEHQLFLYGVPVTHPRFLDAAVDLGKAPEQQWPAFERIPGWIVHVSTSRGRASAAQHQNRSGNILHVQQPWFKTLWRLACKDWSAHAEASEPTIPFGAELPEAVPPIWIFVYIGRQRRNAIGLVVARALTLREPLDHVRQEAPWCGLERVWVHTAYRRCGVATALADTARAHVWAATVVPRHRCAFTELTTAGDAFAVGYVGGRDRIRLYKPTKHI
jgi:GNAT superfamily N-acetyltransferase